MCHYNVCNLTLMYVTNNAVFRIVLLLVKLSQVSDVCIDFRACASISKLRELNPYVEIKLCDHGFGSTADFQALGQYNSVVVCDYYSMDFLQRVDEFCRSYQPPIRVRYYYYKALNLYLPNSSSARTLYFLNNL